MLSLNVPRSYFPSPSNTEVEVQELRDPLVGQVHLLLHVQGSCWHCRTRMLLFVVVGLLFHQHLDFCRVAHETCQEVNAWHAYILLPVCADPSLMMLASWHDILQFL